MNVHIPKNIENIFAKGNAAKTMIVLTLLLLFAFLIFGVQTVYTVLGSDKIYKGVYVSDTNLGGLSRDEAAKLIQTKYIDNSHGASITVTAGSEKTVIKFSEINLICDPDKTAQMAYNVGRRGNIINRITDITKLSDNKTILPVDNVFNEAKVRSAIKSLQGRIYTEVRQPKLEMQSGSVKITSGKRGKSFDMNKAFADVNYLIGMCRNGSLQITIDVQLPEKIDAEDYFNKITTEAKNAYVDFKNNSATVVPHVVGRKVSREELNSLVKELNEKEGLVKTIYVSETEPSVKTEDIDKKLFANTLYSFSTWFSTGTQNDANRGVNIKLAASKINGKIIPAGGIFSFNQIVGERSEALGYKVAHAYEGGRVVDSFGGGVCQVSTTLYNAVFYAGLDVVERINHMFTVGYVPRGMDCAVSYGGADFKFKNTTAWPIKLVSKAEGGNLTFTIIGTIEGPAKNIQAKNVQVKAMEPTTTYTDDPSLAEGKTSVVTEGAKGYIIDTYKIVKQDGKEISNQKIYQSVYSPLNRQVKRGTKKVAAVATPSIVPTQEARLTTPPAASSSAAVAADEAPR